MGAWFAAEILKLMDVWWESKFQMNDVEGIGCGDSLGIYVQVVVICYSFL